MCTSCRPPIRSGCYRPRKAEEPAIPTPDRQLNADGLLRLDAARKALRHHRITSPEHFRAADPDTLASIGREALATIRRVLDGGDPVAVRLLFWDAEAEGVDYDVAQSSGAGGRRLLIVSYDTGTEGERRAWAVLRAMAGDQAGGS